MNSRRGGALVLALIVVMVVGLMATSFLTLNASATKRQAQAVDNKLSFYVAEAGLAESFASLVAGQSGVIGDEATPALFGDGLVWVEPTRLDARHVQLESHGMCGRGSALLSVVARQGFIDPARLGIYTNQDLVLPVGTNVDGYDSADEAEAAESGGWSGAPTQLGGLEEPPTIFAKLGSNGSITVSSSETRPTTVVGDLSYGPTGSADLYGSPDVQGTVSQSSTVIAFPDIEYPDIVGENHLNHVNGAPYVIDPGVHAFLDVTVGADSSLVLTGPLSLVVDSLEVQMAGSLVVDERGGPVELFVRNEVQLSPRSMFEQSAEDTLSFQLLIGGTQTSSLAALGSLYGMIYVPNGTLQMSSSLECHGSLVADALTLAAGSSLHFDAALVESAGLAALPELVSWRIVELGEIDAPRGADVFGALGFDRRLLPDIDEATDDPPLDMDYVDLGGVDQNYIGAWRSFGAWRTVLKVVAMTRDGTAATDEDLIRINRRLEERRVQAAAAALDVGTNVPVETVDPDALDLGS